MIADTDVRGDEKTDATQIFDLKGALAYASGIINTIREPLVVLYPNEIISSVNSSFYKTFKTDIRHTVGKNIFEIGNNQWNIPQLRELLEEILAKKTSFYDFEVEHNFEIIGHKIMLLNASKLIIRENSDQMILLAIEDITERRNLEKKIEKEKYIVSENKRLRGLARQKDEFFSIASHELRTPVTSIKAYAQLMEKDFEEAGNKQAVKMLSRMNVQIDKLAFLITDLLDATKIEAGQFKYHKTNFDFNGLVNEVLDEMRFVTRTHTIEARLAKTLFFFGDRERIGRVITNLLSNAIKYSPGTNTVIINTIHENDQLTLSVEDSGIGILKSDQKKIFGKFFRLKGAIADTFPGLGLGLFISADIIKRHNGIFNVQSKSGKGSVFSFSLPLDKVAAPAMEIAG